MIPIFKINFDGHRIINYWKQKIFKNDELQRANVVEQAQVNSNPASKEPIKVTFTKTEKITERKFEFECYQKNAINKQDIKEFAIKIKELSDEEDNRD